MVHHLAPNGVAGFVLANGSMSSNQSGEGEIRKDLIEGNLVDCMVALPGQLFYSTPIPACLWFLARGRQRRGEILFIDARKLGRMVDRTHRELTDEDIARIADTYHAWRMGKEEDGYADVPGFCKSASLDDVRKHGHVLTPALFRRMPVGGVQGSQDRRYFMERRGDGVSIIRRETKALTGKPPRYRLIDESALCLTIPSAIQEQSPARAVITVRSVGQPLPGADVLVLFPNKTWKRSTSDQHGQASLKLHTTQLPTTVFVAAPGYAAHVEREWRPDQGALAVELEGLPEGGAVIFPEATGYMPGLKGRLNPILDAHDRSYLYASNIAINQGRQEPVHFVPGEDMHLADAEGKELSIRVVDIAGRSTLIEYRPYLQEQE